MSDTDSDGPAPETPDEAADPPDRGVAVWGPLLRRIGLRVGAAVLGFLLIWVVGQALLGVHVVRAKADPVELTERGFSHAVLHALLVDHVVDRDGSGDMRVDYEGLLEDNRLRRYAARLAVTGPTTAPERFETEDERLAYYINAYNALTLLGVVDHWPIETVHDVRGPLEFKAGAGFFFFQRFLLDGDRISLHALENRILRPEFGDARVHAAINCASASCPPLLAAAYDPERLDAQLDAVAQHFASTRPHVGFDTAGQTILLSSIFDWYASDFEEDAIELGAGSEVLDWIAHYADAATRQALDDARDADWSVRYVPYDWSLNGL